MGEPGMDYEAVMREALARIEELQARLRAAEAPRHEPIAIVGIGCRFPGADGPAAYWRLISEGGDAVTEIPSSRWDIEACYDANPDAPGKMYTRSGGFLDGIEEFDAGFFGISPREAISLDPQQRLLMEVCWEAVESAGIPADALSGTASGVFMGIGGVDYYQRLASRAPGRIDAYMASGNAHSIASGRLSYLLGLQGPSLSVDTACSSSLVAVHLACRSLRDRECDLALTGGVSIILSPAIHINHCRSRMLAPDGRCKAFDAAADGFIRSEGCGIVVLKRLADAERAGDRILAVIRGSAVNQDGRTSALTVPNGPAQQAVIRAALADARLEPARVSYVEAHGTGTALGDPIEAAALGAVFSGRPERLPIGSVKANIGHAEAAAGIAGLLKVVLAMQHREIPPQPHFRMPNPRIDWAALPLRVDTVRAAWGTPGEALCAGVSAFGFGGTNAHVVLESYAQAAAEDAAGPRMPELLVLSAKTSSALQTLASRYRTALSATAPPLAAVCASAALGRAHMPVRAAIAADAPAAVGEALDALASGRTASATWIGEARPDLEGRVAFVYPGQGALRWGMGRDLYDAHPAYRAAIDRCAAALRDEWTVSLTDVLYGAVGETLIGRTEYAQAALFATEYALTALWGSLGIHPGAVVGHSVGEFAAACAAGVFDVAEACRLLAARGRLMQPLGGRMAAIAAAEPRVHELIASHPAVAVAAVNGRRQVVVSGERASVDAIVEAAAHTGLASRALAGDVAFHSALMEPMLPAWRDVVARTRFAAPQCDWISTVTGREAAADGGSTYWVDQVRLPVRYAAATERLWAMGYRVVIEVGPSAGLATLAAEAAGESAAEGLWISGVRPGRPELEALREGVAQVYAAGLRLDWQGWYGARRPQVALPTYPFERARYWVDAETAAPAVGDAAAASHSYQVQWAPIAPAPTPARGAWMVCGERSETVDAITAALESHGATVVHDFTSAPSVTGVVHVGALDVVAPGDGVSAASLEEAAVGACLSLAETLRRVAMAAPSARLWAVTRGAVVVNASDRTVNVAQAPIWGIGKVAALEHPETWGGLIDLDPRADTFAGLEALFTAGAGDQLAIRDSRLYVPRLRAASVGRRSAAVVADATYLITGGSGALGLEVAERLIALGARHLLLVARRTPEGAVSARLDGFRRRGVDVRVESADVTSAGEMHQLFARAAVSQPPIRGVVHAAGANGSHALADLDAATLRSVAAAKMSGAWLLHECTRDLPLEFFVGFSSIASVWGSKGQAHYAAANAFLDALVSYRIASGLPGLAINWGPWAAGGMATDEAQGWLRRVGIHPLGHAAALDAFETWLPWPGHVVVADVDWPRFLEVYQARRGQPLFDQMTPSAADALASAPQRRVQSTGPGLQGVGVLSAIRAQAPAEAQRALARLVRDHVVQVLSLDAAHAPAPHQGFFSIGFDSLMALELKNRLAGDLNVSLPSTLAFDYPTIRELSEYLGREVLKLDAGAVPDSAPAAAAVAAAGDAGDASTAAIETTLARLDRLMGKR